MSDESDIEFNEYVCEDCGQLSGRNMRDALYDITGFGPLCKHCQQELDPP